MNENKTNILTSEGLAELQAELENLKVVRRKEVAAKIKDARAQGDLSENAEYDAAKEEQAEIENRIITLETMLRNVEVIDTESLNEDIINLGNKVKLLDMELEEEVEYSIVGATEADPAKGRLSNESPLGAALIGHAVGDVVEYEAPAGVFSFKVLGIQFK